MICNYCKQGIHIGPKWVSMETWVGLGAPKSDYGEGLKNGKPVVFVAGCKGDTWCDCQHRVATR